MELSSRSSHRSGSVSFCTFPFDNEDCLLEVGSDGSPISKNVKNPIRQDIGCWEVNIFLSNAENSVPEGLSHFPYVRLYFNEKPESIDDLRSPVGELILGDWQPKNYNQCVYLYYGNSDKEQALSTGKFKVYYLIDNKRSGGFKQKVLFSVEGKSGVASLISGDKYCEFSKNVLQEKIKPGFNAVSNGLENEDITCYILSKIKHCDSGGGKQNNPVYFRFVHGGDGYWKDYFLRIEEKGIVPFETRRDNFLHDLKLEGLEDGFAVIPIKYNGHFVTIIVNLADKNICLFDSSLYSWIGNKEEDSEEEIKRGSAFRKFLLEDYPGYNGSTISLSGLKTIDVALNKDNLQGQYNTCGFWTIAFCMEVYKNVKNYEDLTSKFNDQNAYNKFVENLRKRISNIIDNEERIDFDIGYSLEEENFKRDCYKIPKNTRRLYM